MLGLVPVDRTGLLIVRAWVEPGSAAPLRAVVRLTTDLAAGIERTVTLADVDEICDTVRAWLGDLLGPGPTGDVTAG